ncbi:hypothetical protein [Sorangium sp. So ce693]|uniref:hypothetical protein n=1 Tax=Sorangium sp. So ce693 TaxID=3133318 RepID=UPI003F604092
MTGAATCRPQEQRGAPMPAPPRPGTACMLCAILAFEKAEQRDHFRGLLAEQRDLGNELMAGLGVYLAARHADRGRRQRAAEPLYDYNAECDVLGAMLRGPCAMPPELFAAPMHFELATAISTGQLTPELMLPEMRGYRRGLMRRRCTPERLAQAFDELVTMTRRRRALEATVNALRALHRPDGMATARAELRRALGLLWRPAE